MRFRLGRPQRMISFSCPSINRAGQRLSSHPTETNNGHNDPWSEIDRRNQRVLHPLNAKDSYGTKNHLPTFNHQRNKLASNSFNLESYNSYCRRRLSSQRNDGQLLEDSFQKLHDKQGSFNLVNNNASFLYANNLLESNKTELMTKMEQQLVNGENSNTYTNKYGVTINEDGPFWPRDFRILHPTPKLLSRELTPKEFYLTVNKSSVSSK